MKEILRHSCQINLLSYRTIILPIFRENEAKIDEVVNQGKEKLAELTEKTTTAMLEDKKDS